MFVKVATAVLTPLVAGYIAQQRKHLLPRAVALSPHQESAMLDYFPAVDTSRVRIVVADPLPIAEPPFSRMLRKLSFDFPSIATVSAITFDDVIAVRQPMTANLLFHELVHVVQYRVLGISGFAREYVRGFLSTRQYEQIPLEVIAFHLEQRFSGGDWKFDVETEVMKQLR